MENQRVRILLLTNDDGLSNAAFRAIANGTPADIRRDSNFDGVGALLRDQPAEIALLDVATLTYEAIRHVIQAIQSCPAPAGVIAIAPIGRLQHLSWALQCGAVDVVVSETAFDDHGDRVLRHSIEQAVARRRTEQTLRRRNSLLEAAVANLAGGIAHEFNNALQTILGYTKAVMQELDRGDRRYIDLDEVMTAASRAAKLTRQLLAYSRRQNPKFSPVDVSLIAASAVNMLRPMLGGDISIETIYHSRRAIIQVDPAMFEQVLIHLCLNARDAMPEGGRIVIRTADVEITADDARRIDGINAGHYVQLSVSDTGAGMAPEVRERVFEPFFTTKEPGEGTGLGMAMVQGIVHQHGGAIEFISEPGIGTIFHIYLRPADLLAVNVSPQTLLPPELSQQKVEAILLADDHEAIRGLATRILGAAGYQVFEAADGRQAIDVFEAHSDEIALAVLDAVMPLANGWSVAARIRELRPQLPILLVTGYEASGKIMANGPPIQVLEKPFTSDELLKAVRNSLFRAS